MGIIVYNITDKTIEEDSVVIKRLPSCITNEITGGITKSFTQPTSAGFDDTHFLATAYNIHVDVTSSGPSGGPYLGFYDAWGSKLGESTKAFKRGFFTPIHSLQLSAGPAYDIQVVSEGAYSLDVGLFDTSFNFDQAPQEWTLEDDGLFFANYPNIDASPSGSAFLTTTGASVEITGQASVLYELTGACDIPNPPNVGTILNYGAATFNAGSTAALSAGSYDISGGISTTISSISGCGNIIVNLYDFSLEISSDVALVGIYDKQLCDGNNDSIDDIAIIWDAQTFNVTGAPETKQITLATGSENELSLGVFDDTIYNYLDTATYHVTAGFEAALISGGPSAPFIKEVGDVLGHAYDLEGFYWNGPPPDTSSWTASGGSDYASAGHISRYDLSGGWGKVKAYDHYEIPAPPVEKQDSSNSRIRLTATWFYGPVKGHIRFTTQSETIEVPMGIFAWPRGTGRYKNKSLIQDVVIPWADYPIQIDLNPDDAQLIREHNKLRYWIRIKDDLYKDD